MNFDDFEEIKNRSEIFYKSLIDVYSPYLKEYVRFNAQALEHLKFKKRGTARLEQDQYMRFKLIHLAPHIIELSRTVQGVWKTKRFETLKINSVWRQVLKEVTYYEFIAVIKRDRVKIIIKQIDSGELFFWSIIPFWKMDKETNNRIFHEGIPEED